MFWCCSQIVCLSERCATRSLTELTSLIVVCFFPYAPQQESIAWVTHCWILHGGNCCKARVISPALWTTSRCPVMDWCKSCLTFLIMRNCECCCRFTHHNNNISSWFEFLSLLITLCYFYKQLYGLDSSDLPLMVSWMLVIYIYIH